MRAVPFCSVPLALDREEAVGVQWADGADASEEPLFVVSGSLTQHMPTLRMSLRSGAGPGERERSGGSGDGQKREALFGLKRPHEPVWRRVGRLAASA